MSRTSRRWALLVGCATSLGLALLPFAAPPSAAAQTSCGLVAVHATQRTPAFWSLNRVQASGVSCAAARGLVRRWAVAMIAGRIPARVIDGKVNARGVTVYGQFGPPGAFDGYSCRWMYVSPHPGSAYLPGAGRCTAGAAVVSWSYTGASNPSLGGVRGCRGGVVVGRADATTIRAHLIGCARAKRMIHYLLAHRAIRPAYYGLRLVRRRVRGFTLSQHGAADFRARRGRSWFSFTVYWYSCGCASDASARRAPRLLINVGRSFRVRPAMVVVGMVAITGPGVSSSGYRAGRYGHIHWVRWSHQAFGEGLAWVPNGPGQSVRSYTATVRAWRVRDGRYTRLEWSYGRGANGYTEWDKLIRFGGSYNWRYVRST